MHVPCGNHTFHDPRLPRQREGIDDERAGSRLRRDHTDERYVVLTRAVTAACILHCLDGALGEPVPGDHGGSYVDQRTVHLLAAHLCI